mmetsp:Transcript_28764/g.57387  ORF Transcript_28764/g.57387 Transcript_28764/m.57387 type:complete len:105 (-) Transcript_28764:435-749(-)
MNRSRNRETSSILSYELNVRIRNLVPVAKAGCFISDLLDTDHRVKVAQNAGFYIASVTCSFFERPQNILRRHSKRGARLSIHDSNNTKVNLCLTAALKTKHAQS